MTANKKGKNLLNMQYFNEKCDYCVLLTSLLIWFLSAMDQARNEWKSNLIFNKNYEKNVFFALELDCAVNGLIGHFILPIEFF